MIQIVNLYKKFKENNVINGLNIEIPKGKITAVIGQSGCGKSVLLKLILKILNPDSGNIFVDNEEITDLDKAGIYRIRRKFGMLFQNAALFDSMTCAENISLGLREHTKLAPDEIRTIVQEKLGMVGLPGVDEMMTTELSGGMKKRVGLARALAMNPEYVLYDEPTTGLDPIMANTINRLIFDLNKTLQITSVIVTHDLKTVYEVVDNVAMLYNGVINFYGSTDEFRKTDDPVVTQFISGNSE